jgi:Crp-like helix-turn-helix domain
MATHDVEARLCRWLLRARDLSDTDTLLFTQEFLAEMFRVRRTSVTSVAHTQRAGMIKYTRGKIQILSVDIFCGCLMVSAAPGEHDCGAPVVPGQPQWRGQKLFTFIQFDWNESPTCAW